jgi:hypothetical protein
MHPASGRRGLLQSGAAVTLVASATDDWTRDCVQRVPEVQVWERVLHKGKTIGTVYDFLQSRRGGSPSLGADPLPPLLQEFNLKFKEEEICSKPGN